MRRGDLGFYWRTTCAPGERAGAWPVEQVVENKAHKGVLELVHYCGTIREPSKIYLILRETFLLGTALVLRLERKLHRINSTPGWLEWRAGCNGNAEREAQAGDPWRQRTVFENVC